MKLGLVAGAAILPRYKLTSLNHRSLTATKNHPEEYATIGICNLCTCPLLWLDFYLAKLQLVQQWLPNLMQVTLNFMLLKELDTLFRRAFGYVYQNDEVT